MTTTATKDAHSHPWRQMVDTFIWVEQQQRASKSGWSTAQWVLEQQMRTIYGTDIDEERLKSLRKRVGEVTTRDGRSATRSLKTDRERTLGQCLRKQRETITWAEYEARWDALRHSTQPLTFRDIPWPQARQPTREQQVSPVAVRAFLWREAETEVEMERRKKKALLVWHPDRFRRFMCRVVEKDKSKVEEGVGIVARALTAKERSITVRGKHA